MRAIHNRTPLIAAIRSNRNEAAHFLLDAGADPLASSNNGWVTLLHVAQFSKDATLAQRLLDAGVPVDCLTSSEYTPLMIACRYKGHPDVVDVLMDAGADANIKTRTGYTPLMQAAWYQSDPEIMRMLLLHTKDVNEKTEGWSSTALMFAAQYNSHEIVKALLDGGADSKMVNSQGENVLVYAARHKDANKPTIHELIQRGVEVTTKDKAGLQAGYHLLGKCDLETLELVLASGLDVRAEVSSRLPVFLRAVQTNGNIEAILRLIEAGANVNAVDSQGINALGHAAISNPSIEVVRLLQERGFDANAVDRRGDTPTVLATRNKSIEILQFLLATGGDLTVRNNEQQTALMQAAQYNQNEEMISFLLSQGQEIEDSNANQQTAFLIAARYNDLPVLRKLVEAGANVHAVDKDGASALLLAASFNRRANVIRWLVKEHGLDVNAVDGLKQTPLHRSTKSNTVEISHTLVDLEANPKGIDQNGETALMNAARFRNAEIVERLLYVGAEANVQNNKQQTALMFAVERGDKEMVEFLLKSEADVHAVDEGGKSVLMYALGKGTMPVIRMLLDNGASLESVTTQGQSIWDILVANRRADVWEHFAQEVIRLHKEDPNKSPLFQIITRGDMGFVDTLLKEGADINWSNPEGASWLMLMAQHPSRSSSDLERFIRRGVNINAQDKKGDTALIYAIKNNAPVDKLEMLVRHGANVALSNQSGETALSLVRQMPRYAYLAQRWQGVVKDNALQDEPLRLAITRAEGKQRILQLMADEQDINRLDKNGKPVLLYLLEHDKDGELITALLERKVDLRVGVPEGMSVLDYAVQQGYSAVGIQILVRAGVKLKARNERGRDGLMIALFRRYEAPVIQALLDAGGDVEARDAEGRTPLIHAVRSYRYQDAELSLPVVQALFQAGASLEVRDNYGKSAVDYLQESGENKLLEAIVALK